MFGFNHIQDLGQVAQGLDLEEARPVGRQVGSRFMRPAIGIGYMHRVPAQSQHW